MLVVDDVESNLDVATGMMKPYGMRIDCVTSGQQAIELVRAGQTRYDAIFMDHMMPNMDGVEALQRIRAIGTKYAATIPVVALTANVISGNEQRFLEKGFQAFIAKPIDMLRLDAVIQRFVRNKELEKAQTQIDRMQTAKDGGAQTAQASLLSDANIPDLDVKSALERLSGDTKAYRQAL